MGISDCDPRVDMGGCQFLDPRERPDIEDAESGTMALRDARSSRCSAMKLIREQLFILLGILCTHCITCSPNYEENVGIHL